MAINVKEIFKFLFPEYQIMACIDERGLIAKAVPSRPVQNASVMTVVPGPVQGVEMTPSSKPVQDVAIAPPVSQALRTRQKPYIPAKNDAKSISKANDAFDGLADALEKNWGGSRKDRSAICGAYQRPYIRGFDNNKPRNAILLISSESGGREHLIHCISELLWQKKVFRYAGISIMDFARYAVDTSNALFLGDLDYELNTSTETVLFENVDQATPAQLDVIYQLLNRGCYKLSGQNTVNQGGVTGVAGAWNAELILELVTNGKYFVFATSVPQREIVSFLGSWIVRELSDIITLDPIRGNHVLELEK